MRAMEMEPAALIPPLEGRVASRPGTALLVLTVWPPSPLLPGATSPVPGRIKAPIFVWDSPALLGGSAQRLLSLPAGAGKSNPKVL